jgi:hypothetical protein
MASDDIRAVKRRDIANINHSAKNGIRHVFSLPGSLFLGHSHLCTNLPTNRTQALIQDGDDKSSSYVVGVFRRNYMHAKSGLGSNDSGKSNSTNSNPPSPTAECLSPSTWIWLTGTRGPTNDNARMEGTDFYLVYAAILVIHSNAINRDLETHCAFSRPTDMPWYIWSGCCLGMLWRPIRLRWMSTHCKVDRIQFEGEPVQGPQWYLFPQTALALYKTALPDSSRD